MWKMRGVIDPYTLGFLLALIGTAGAHIAHSNKQTDVTDVSIQTEEHAAVTTQNEDDTEFFD